MWAFPKCKHRFVNTNQWHSCGQNTVDRFLTNKTEKASDLYTNVIEEFKKIGEFELHPAKTRIALNKKMRFGSINKLGKDFLDAHLVFTQRFYETLCFHKIDSVTNTTYVHHFRIYSQIDLTKELKKYMKLAYEIGTRKHLEKRNKK